MDSEKIELLLKKYWDGDTTQEEEQVLRTWFSTADVPDHLKETAALFQYFEQSKQKKLNDITFDGHVMERMKVVPKKGKVVKLLNNTLRIAAGVAVLAVATWMVTKDVKETDPQQLEDTFDNPKMAFEETKKALLMISKGFGTAEQQAKKINMFNEAQEEIQNKEKEETRNL